MESSVERVYSQTLYELFPLPVLYLNCFREIGGGCPFKYIFFGQISE